MTMMFGFSCAEREEAKKSARDALRKEFTEGGSV
jgi:hypothetical protein